jgi:hypothetical protein
VLDRRERILDHYNQSSASCQPPPSPFPLAYKQAKYVPYSTQRLM